MKAVTFDFYNTLVRHRAGSGRGKQYVEYIAAAGLACDPWQHKVLYDVFEYYGQAYRTAFSTKAKDAFWAEFTRRLFERTNVRADGPLNHAAHAPAIRDIMGPACLAVYEEVPAVLRALKHAGMRLAVISDWQKGLPHFVEELGLAGYFDAVVASAEVGYQKPDPRLFEEARARLRVPARETLHVGDLPEDIEGARAAGFSAVFLARQGQPPAIEAPVITDLRGLLPMI